MLNFNKLRFIVYEIFDNSNLFLTDPRIPFLLPSGKKQKQLASSFNYMYRYIDRVLSMNNQYFLNYLGKMFPVELEIKNATESNTYAYYPDLLLSIGRDDQLHTSNNEEPDDFNFHIINFPFPRSNIPHSLTYGVFISQLIRYVWACSSYERFMLKIRRLASKLRNTDTSWNAWNRRSGSFMVE